VRDHSLKKMSGGSRLYPGTRPARRSDGDLLARAGDPSADFAPLGDIPRMAGTAGVFGATALHQRLSRMEKSCRAGDHAAVRDGMADLAALWQATQTAFRDRAYRLGGDLAQASSLR
jgi:hypothetical protein